MAWEPVKSGVDEFLVDWGVVERFVRNYWRSCYQFQYSRTVVMSESSWYNPFSWSLPEIATLEVPWDDVRSWTDTAVESDMAIYRATSRNDMRSVAYDVQYKMRQVPTQRARFRNELKTVERRNLQAMQDSVNDYEGLIDASRFIRDTSADVVAIGSTIATGGAATALLAGSAAMKGSFKYQDTGSVGAGIVYGVGSAALGVFKVGGKSLTKAGEYALIVANGCLETGTGLVAGDSFGKAVGAGTLKVASQGVAQAVFGSEAAKKLFERMGLPFAVWVKTQETPDFKMFEDRAGKFALGVTKKLAEKTVKAGINAGIGALSSSPAAPGVASNGLAAEVPFEDQLLLYLSIINMKEGIGRGW